MAGSDVKVIWDGDPSRIVRALEKIAANTDKVNKKLAEQTRASQQAGKESESAFGKAAKSALGLVGAYVSVRGAINAVRGVQNLWMQDIQKTAEISRGLVDDYRTLAIMKGQEWPGFRKALGPMVTGYAGPGGVGAGYRAAETVVSLMPGAFGFTQAQQLGAAQQTLGFAEAYSMEPAVAAGMIGKAGGMMSKYGVTPTQWSNALAGVIKRGGYAGAQLQEWAGAMPTLYGGALTAGLNPAETLAFGQVMSQVTGSPAQGMGGAEQVLRLIMGTKATRAFPGMADMGAMDRMGYMANLWQARGPAAMRPQIEAGFGARGMRYLPRALEKWDIYGPALAATQADLAFGGDIVAGELGGFRAQDVPGRLTALSRIAANRATMARLGKGGDQAIVTGRDMVDALSLELGMSPVSRWWGRGVYNWDTFLGATPVQGIEDAMGFMPGLGAQPRAVRQAWQAARPEISAALSGEANGPKLDRIAELLEQVVQAGRYQALPSTDEVEQ